MYGDRHGGAALGQVGSAQAPLLNVRGAREETEPVVVCDVAVAEGSCACTSAMTTWEEYHELVSRLETEQARREASGEAPSEDLVRAVKAHLIACEESNSLLAAVEGPAAMGSADAQTDSPLCALPDDTLLRAAGFASNARIGAMSTTARRLARLIFAHKETLFRPSADGADAVGATGLELVRLEAWADNKQHEERPTVPDPPRRRMSLDGLLCHVKITQTPKGDSRYIDDYADIEGWCSDMRATVLSLPPLEPVVLASRWLELNETAKKTIPGVDPDEPEHTYLELTVPAFDFSLHSNITLDIALYNPRTKLVATLFRGDGEDEQEMEDSSSFFFEDDETSCLYSHIDDDGDIVTPMVRASLHCDSDRSDDTCPYVFVNGTIHVSFGQKCCSYWGADFEDRDDVCEELGNLRWAPVVVSEPRPVEHTDPKEEIRRAVSSLHNRFGDGIGRMSHDEIVGRVALLVGADVTRGEYRDFILQRATIRSALARAQKQAGRH